MNNLLLVEDDISLSSTIEYLLKKEDFNIYTSNNIDDAKYALETNNIDLVILDVTLPDGNGFDFCSFIKNNNNIPIIFLTALDEEDDIVKGLDIGDDYITKPFKTRELVSRIKNILRRNNKELKDNIRIYNIDIDTKKYKVYKNNVDLELTSLEFKLLLYLVHNKGQVLTRESIIKCMWDNFEKYVNDNTLTVYIKRLREKIEDDSNNPTIIKTVRNVGYIVED